jgi:heme/copper-type cytochrome/quinol oxidase subunit 2
VKAARLLLSVPFLACAGCETRGWQSALDPQSNDADRLERLMHGFTIVCVVVWVLVIAVLLLTLFRSRTAVVPTIQPSAVSQKRATVIVSAGIGATVIVITGLTLLSYVTTRALTADKPGALTVRLRGYQWWWEFAYLDGRPDEIITTANELHIPVGRRVHILLDAPDVIHSFWVPTLAGKKDLIPGRDNEITIEADRPGLTAVSARSIAACSTSIWLSWWSRTCRTLSRPGKRQNASQRPSQSATTLLRACGSFSRNPAPRAIRSGGRPPPAPSVPTSPTWPVGRTSRRENCRPRAVRSRPGSPTRKP